MNDWTQEQKDLHRQYQDAKATLESMENHCRKRMHDYDLHTEWESRSIWTYRLQRLSKALDALHPFEHLLPVE